ncbi:MAG: HNH endonuclease signature motif containing protein [Roseiflexaceae bacterium]
MTRELPEEFLRICRNVKSKRPKTVIDHIIEYGYITTEELKNKYGYNHPPRAARDVREQGVPLETFYVKSSDGRKIAAYKFGDITKVRADRLSGRTVIPKNFKQSLLQQHSSRCSICLTLFEERYLQVDHRIPYEIAGEISSDRNTDDYMLLCASDNRSKSWSCEHCKNWQEYKNEDICRSCYWAYPENYTHIAMRSVRRVDILWDDQEINLYDQLKDKALQQHKDVSSYIKDIIANHLKSN